MRRLLLLLMLIMSIGVSLYLEQRSKKRTEYRWMNNSRVACAGAANVPTSVYH